MRMYINLCLPSYVKVKQQYIGSECTYVYQHQEAASTPKELNFCAKNCSSFAGILSPPYIHYFV